jgi:hypothetical protein
VGKGSRQNRSVTSGKGLALRVGSKGPSLEVEDFAGGPRRIALHGVVFCGTLREPLLKGLGCSKSSLGGNTKGVRVPSQGGAVTFFATINNRLRTGTDKGNPTV